MCVLVVSFLQHIHEVTRNDKRRREANTATPAPPAKEPSTGSPERVQFVSPEPSSPVKQTSRQNPLPSAAFTPLAGFDERCDTSSALSLSPDPEAIAQWRQAINPLLHDLSRPEPAVAPPPPLPKKQDRRSRLTLQRATPRPQRATPRPRDDDDDFVAPMTPSRQKRLQ